MNVIGFIFLSTVMVLTTIILIVAMIANSESPKFDPVKSLGLTAGVYQNISTGRIIEIKNFDGNLAYAVDQFGSWNIRYDILDKEYAFIGEL